MAFDLLRRISPAKASKLRIGLASERLLDTVTTRLKAKGVDHAVIGGVAVVAHGFFAQRATWTFSLRRPMATKHMRF